MAPTRRPGAAPGSSRRSPSSRAGASRGGVPPRGRRAPRAEPRPRRPARPRPAPPRPRTPSRPPGSTRGRRPAAPQRSPRSMRRMAILASILVMLAVTLVPTLRSYLQQQSEYTALQAKVSEQRRSVEALTRERQQWDDPAYVEQQVRERLKFVRPGERSYTVIDADPAPRHASDPRVAAAAPEDVRNSPWYGQLWQSMVIADSGSAADAGDPASRQHPQSLLEHQGTVTSSQPSQRRSGGRPGRPPRGRAAARPGPPRASPRSPTAARAVARTCCATEPRLPDGTPFPTTYYATCPRLTGAISTLETTGMMREMTERLGQDPALAAAYQRRARGLPAPAGRARLRAGDRGHLRRRDAHAGQVPARAGRALAGRRTRGQPARRRGARGAAAVVGRRVLRARAGRDDGPPAGDRPRDAGRRDRLRHQLDPPAGGRRGAGVARRSPSLVDVVRRMEIVRLGHGVDRTGVIAPEAMARTLAMAGDYAAQCEKLEVERVRFVATSASRDARNAEEFVDGVRTAFSAYGIAPEVVSGHEEASLSFLGATGGLQAHGVDGPYLVVDIGGGSTEFVRGTHRRGAGPVGRHRLRPDDRAAPAHRPADRCRGRGRDRGRRRGDRPGRRGGGPGRGRGPRRAGRLGHHHHRARAAADRLRPRAHPPRRAAGGPGRRGLHRAAGHDPRRAGGAWGSCTPAGSTSSAPARWCGAASSSACTARPASAQVVTSEHDILDGIALSLA